MIVFDNWKFREILKSIVDKKELNGDRIYSKQQLYIRILNWIGWRWKILLQQRFPAC